MIQKIEQLKQVVAILLDSDRSACSLQSEVVEMIGIFEDSQTVRFTAQQDILEQETTTSNGLALPPTMAAMCADDFRRTIAFIRGTYAAIIDIRKQFPDRPARILYAGCGPYATLAVPLMAVLSSSPVACSGEFHLEAP